MDFLKKYNDTFQEHLDNIIYAREPQHLYEPVTYMMSLGGKRLRPMLTLASCDFFGTAYHKALPAAVSLELFHNFSLMHDDIMDKAPLRRGSKTVHEKWGLNTGILSGDAMLILAYQLFERYEPVVFRELAELFSKTALQVCEGQQYDIDFETRETVSLPEYMTMIEYKTAVLLGAAMKMGAIVANASENCKENSYAFGRNLGIAFQLQDDYLDVFGDPSIFGKQPGGDIISNKKTFLYVTALEQSNASEAEKLQQLYSITPKDPSEKIRTVTTLFEASGAAKALQHEIEAYTQKAFDVLENLHISEAGKENLRDFGSWLMNREV